MFCISLQENAKRRERRESDCSRLSAGKGMTTCQEDRVVGTISSRLYWDYFRSGLHGVLLLFLLLLFFIAQGKSMVLLGKHLSSSMSTHHADWEKRNFRLSTGYMSENRACMTQF